VGRLKRYKNLDHLLVAYKAVKEEIRDSQLIIIGTGDREPEARKLTEKLSLRDVYFLGKVPEEEKIMWMQRAWIIASTSVREGWGITILEAAACRTPAVAYNVPGLRDSVKHMETGILVEPGDTEQLAKALTWILEDDNTRTRLSENAYKHAQKYSWDRSAEDFLEALKSAAEA